MTSSGSSGGAETRSHPESLVSQSRTYCLSYDGCAAPGAQEDAGQNRDESGVSTSSPSTSDAPSSPNSNFVSARTIPAASAISAAREYSASVSARNSSARSAPTADTTDEKSIASSCSPTGALVDGVNTGAGSREPSTRPSGMATSRME